MERVIEATWDIAALGMRSQVLNLAHGATAADLSVLDSMDAPYRVVRLPVAAHYLLHDIQARGYVFAELQTRMHHDATVPVLDGIYSRAVNAVEMRDATRDDIDHIQNRILSGIFRTDRISLDPRFGAAVSARRYSRWFCEAIRGGALCHVLTRSGVPFAFSLQERESQSLRGLLGALLDASSSRGMGWCIPYFEIVAAVRLAASAGVYNTISSNNFAVQRTAEELGFRVDHQEYVFVNNPASDVRLENRWEIPASMHRPPAGSLCGSSGTESASESAIGSSE